MQAINIKAKRSDIRGGQQQQTTTLLSVDYNNEMVQIASESTRNLLAQRKYEDFIHNSLVLPKKYYQLVEQNK